VADYVASALLPFQARINKKYNAAELRELQNPILRNALNYADLLAGPQKVQDIKQSDKRAVYTYYLKRMAATNGTARSYAPTGVQADSGQVTLSWVTFSETLAQYMQVGYDNVFDDVTLLDHQIMDKQRILRERIGTYIVQQLHNNRTQTSYSATLGPGGTDATKIMSFNGTNFAFENSATYLSTFFENAANVMAQNKYYDNLDVIADPVIYRQARYLQAQGQGNAQNLSYQFTKYNPDGIMFHSVLGTSVAENYPNGCAIVLPYASFSCIPWIPKINRDTWGNYSEYNGGFGTIPDGTGLPLVYAVRAWTQKIDGSGNGSVTQTVQVNMELSVDIAFNTAPISNSGETPVYEFGQLQ
jgi:hypothetical protein